MSEEENKKNIEPEESEEVTAEENAAEAEAEDVTEAAEDVAEDTVAGADEQEDEEDVSETGTEKKKSFFKKDKKEKKDKKDELIEELSDKVKRQLAEFENFRNRTEREKSAMFEMGAKSVLEKILPVVDNFERGFTGVAPEGEDAFVKGMEQVYKQLTTTLSDLGVTPIEALGCEFDPNLHNAVMQEESEEYGSGVICKELQKGYKYKDTVIRHSMVSVVP